MATQFYCNNERRRALVREPTDADNNPVTPVINGIDYLEVDTSQTILNLYFLHNLPLQLDPVPPAPAPALDAQNLHIEGGVRIRDIKVENIAANNNVLTITVNQAGDFSNYILKLRASLSADYPPEGFDSQLSDISFNFKVDCDDGFDCEPEALCPPEEIAEPVIDYLAKDYSSFRQLMLERMSLVMPDWQERNAADQQMMLVEMLAYVGDQLSYIQDAVATEAYLDPAHRRTSVRRHTKLLDYPVHEGSNARAWLALEVEAGNDGKILPAASFDVQPPRFVSRSRAATGALSSKQLDEVRAEGVLIFEPLHDLTVFEAHNKLLFYTWGSQECCLPKGAMRATLKGHYDNLKVGDVLIVEELQSPSTGTTADADPSHRHALRLSSIVTEREGSALTDPLSGQAITEITWHSEDALPFPLCVSAVTNKEHGERYLEDISVARGNVVLVDHGESILAEALPDVPSPNVLSPSYRPTLTQTPITQQGRVLVERGARQISLPFDESQAAAAVLSWQVADVLPVLRIDQTGSGDSWQAQHDLLSSDAFDRDVVVEVEENASYLRFGDGVLGERPKAGTALKASYRVGKGSVGNVGAESLVNIVIDPNIYDKPITIIQPDQVNNIRNPLPAQGGTEPESLEQVKRFAPQAFRIQERAVTEADYAEVAERHPEIQKAAATFRWTGSWLTVFVTLDRKGAREFDDDFLARMVDHISRYRLAGYDLTLSAPSFVPLDISMTVCALQGYFKSDVKEALLETLSSRALPNGKQGFFHPDHFTFSQPLYLSQLYEAALHVPGVASLSIDNFKRFAKAPNQELENGLLPTDRLEIIRLDNDPNFPENGKLDINMQGGI